MKRAAVLLLVLVSLPPASAEDEPRIRIGTWNLENLGSRRKERRTDEDYGRIAAVIRDELAVDLLAVQEVNGAGPLRKLCKALGEDYTFLIGSSGGFRDEPRRISVGFVWNTKRLTLLGAEELLDLPDTTEHGVYIFHRKPVVATFRAANGGIDFRAIAVHLKAGRRDRGRRGERDSAKRKAEVKLLGERIAALLARAGEDQDLVVLGDFNHDRTYPAHEVFKRWVEYLTPPQHHRSIIHFDEQIDHVAVSPGLKEEVVGGSLTIHSKRAEQDGATWRSSYSDHIPVTVDLRAKQDGDPDATFSPPAEGQKLEAGAEAPPERLQRSR